MAKEFHEKKDDFFYKNKNLTEIRADSSWQVFRMMAEVVEGYEKLNKLGPSISVFGSARTKPEHKYYKLGVEIAKEICKEDYGIITGGGPGMMEAFNKGAQESGGKSVGLVINLPMEEVCNRFIDPEMIIKFRYFFVRKVMFVKYAYGFIFMPGGFGTMDELFEVLTLIQTHKISKVPIVLVGKEFWSGLYNWMKTDLQDKNKNIGKEDLEHFIIVDEPHEVIKYIKDFYKDHDGEFEEFS